MKNLNTKIIVYILAILLGLPFSSCKKALDIGSPPTMLTPDKVFESDASATAAALGNYTSLGTFDANFVPYLALYTDELNQTTLDGLSTEFANGNLTVTNGAAVNMWQNLYVTIYKANANLTALNSATKLSDTIRKQLLGEALFTRAYCYFNLINLFGDVPLTTTTDVRMTSTLPRSATTDVYKQIVADLIKAKSLLGANYPTAEKIRPNKMAATALLARVYLYLQEWQNADVEASEVINSGLYTLSALGDVFKKSSSESIWQLWNQTGYTSLSVLVPADSGDPAYIISNQLKNAFENGDRRKDNWTKIVIGSGGTYTAPFKYKDNTLTSGDDAEYVMYLRIAEQYLIRAEAKARLANDLVAATKDLNTIRLRAGLPSISATLSSEELISAISHERQVELFAEGGHRFFDLKRRNELNGLMLTVKPSWNNIRSPLMPIPQTQRIINPSLSQNPGY